MKLDFICNCDCKLKEFLQIAGISKRQAKKIKLYGKFYINGEIAKNYYPVKVGDKITIEFPDKENLEIKVSNKELDILYEDEYLLIVNKPYDLATQPSNKYLEENLISRVIGYFNKKGEKASCHVVTRLDYATSGLVLIAKYPHVHKLLSEVKIEKKYLAKVKGKFTDVEGKIELPIDRDPTSPIKRMVREDGKNAITLYKVIKYELDYSILELTLITGRTHQIRVHLSHLGYPIVGDKLYDGEESNYLHLHAFSIEFIHPIKQNKISINVYPNWINF